MCHNYHKQICCCFEVPFSEQLPAKHYTCYGPKRLVQQHFLKKMSFQQVGIMQLVLRVQFGLIWKRSTFFCFKMT